jgi:tetratricopeptide (TPR) repeat protein/predicted aspartyl protease
VKRIIAPVARRLAVAVAAATLFDAAAASAACKLERLAELPVTMSDLRPTVPAKIDGRTIRMLADTGAFFSMISPGLATEMKLPLHPAPFGLVVTGVGGAINPSLTTVKGFTLDKIPLRHVDFIVGGSESGNGIDGVIGRNLLMGVDSEYDLANGIIRIMRPSNCFDQPLAYWAGSTSWSSVRMIIDDNANERRPEAVVIVTINGRPLKATLDTGASNTVIWRSAALRAGMPISGERVSDSGFLGGVGKRVLHDIVAPVRSFKIGDEEIKNTKIIVVNGSVEGSDMLLGADFFLAHRIYISNSQQKVYFTYNGGPVFSLVAKPLDSLVASATANIPKPEPAKNAPGEPNDAAEFSRRGEAFASRRDYPRAIADLDRAVAMAPDNADYVFQRAMVRLENDQVSLAMADIERTLRLRPTDSDALLTRAELRASGEDQSAAAVDDLNAVASSLPEAADVRLRLANLYQQLGKMPQAIAQYSLWISAHPDDNRHATALGGRCWARALLNQELDRALSDCNGAVKSNPRGAGFLESRGLVFLRLGQLDRAIGDYNASLAIAPKRARSLYGRGLTKMRLGDLRGGKADLSAATSIDPKIAAQAAKYGLNPPPAP